MAEHEDKSKEHGEGQGAPSHGGGHGGGHGIGHEEHHEGAPEWLISFADNVALIMGFFVILLAMNMGPKADPVQGGQADEVNVGEAQSTRMMDFAIAVRESFNNPVDMNSTNPAEARMRQRKKELLDKEANPNTDGPVSSEARQNSVRPTEHERPTGVIPFEAGLDTIGVTGLGAISELAFKLRGTRWVIEVRGHVSPSETGRDVGRAMQLSHERAMAVFHALLDQGLKPEQLRVVAAGFADRIVPRAYEPERDAGNQRVEVVVTDRTLAGALGAED